MSRGRYQVHPRGLSASKQFIHSFNHPVTGCL
jgi:hypothetical protein